jgi:hypothetical protein
MRKLSLFTILATAAVSTLAQSSPPPVCEGKMQCEAMWVDAQKTVEMVTRMRIRFVSDSRIETYAPVRYASMGGVVTKYPISEDKYELRLQLECYRNTDCSDVRVMGTDLFNKTVGQR